MRDEYRIICIFASKFKKKALWKSKRLVLRVITLLSD